MIYKHSITIFRLMVVSFLILSAQYSLAYAANEKCILTELTIEKIGNNSVAIKVIDNSLCLNYKFVSQSNDNKLFKLVADNISVMLENINIDPFSASKIETIIPKADSINFKFSYIPDIKISRIDGKRFFFFTPPIDFIFIDNVPANMIKSLKCRRSMGVVDIETASNISFKYGKISDNILYIDLLDTYLSDKTEVSEDCKKDITYSILPSPDRVRLIVTNANYLENILYSKAENIITFTSLNYSDNVYITKMYINNDDITTTLGIKLSSGDITSMQKRSDTEYVIEVNENTSNIGSLMYERRFVEGSIRSIGKQRIGKNDKFIVRVDKDTIVDITEQDSGFSIRSTINKFQEVEK